MTKVGRAAMSTKASVTNRLDVERIEARSKRAFRRSIRAAVRSSWRRPANGACASFVHHQRHTRPGGTISGAAMFMLADFAVYVAIIAALGEIGLQAVTTNLNINFLAKPKPRDLIAEVRLIRLGRRWARLRSFPMAFPTWRPMPLPP